MERVRRRNQTFVKTPSGGVGLLGALAIGIGGMVGGGIFAVLGEAVALAHGATAIAFGVGGVVAYLTSYSYAKLSVRYPGQGGTVVFVDQAFGIDLVSGTLNMILWLSYLVTLSLYAVAFGSYGLTFLPGQPEPWIRHLLVSLAILLPLAINLLNAEIISKTETLIVGAKLVLLLVVILAGFPHMEPARFAPETWGKPFTVMAAGMMVFVAYEGFELIANSAGDVRDPSRTLPRAFYGSVLAVVFLYILVALVTVGTIPEERLASVKDYALAEAAKPALGPIGFILVAIAALLATLSAINATIYGNARLGYTLAKEGELPEILDRLAWNEPVSGVLIVGTLSLLIANFIDLTVIAIISSAGFLLIFAVVNAAAGRLAREIGAKKWICALGFLACLGALVTLLAATYRDNPRALWVFLAFILFSLFFELVYPRIRHRRWIIRNIHATKT